MSLHIGYFSHLQQLQPWFKVDPMVLRLFIKMTKMADILVLIGKVSLSILIMRLAEESFNNAQVIILYYSALVLRICVNICAAPHIFVLHSLVCKLQPQFGKD